jgi:tetratricopeptide (TPR) repeat protein
MPGVNVRRIGVAAFAVVLGLTIMRAQLATALTVRGDTFLYRGNAMLARTFYERALWIDRDCELAAKRLAFVTLSRPSETTLGRVVEVLDEQLARDPTATELRIERAFCLEHLRRYDRAGDDFLTVASRTRSAKYYLLAGWEKWRSGEHNDAHRYWRAALRIDPGYTPARMALREEPPRERRS